MYTRRGSHLDLVPIVIAVVSDLACQGKEPQKFGKMDPLSSSAAHAASNGRRHSRGLPTKLALALLVHLLGPPEASAACARQFSDSLHPSKQRFRGYRHQL
jgi:hypothetical protein